MIKMILMLLIDAVCWGALTTLLVAQGWIITAGLAGSFGILYVMHGVIVVARIRKAQMEFAKELRDRYSYYGDEED